MDRLFFALGSIGAALAVGFGAFGAHALKARLAPASLALWETGARYQLAHALALLALAWAVTRWPHPAIARGGWLIVAGTVLFCGSLYALALGAGRSAGIVTPIGGVAWLAGWACVAWGVLRAGPPADAGRQG